MKTLMPVLFALVFLLPTAGQPAAGVPPGIEQLHQEDIAATLAGDPQRLANLFTEDGVLLEPGSPVQSGRATILAKDLKEKQAQPQIKPLEYKPEIHDLRVHGDWAVEWTYFSAAYQEKPGAPTQRFRGKGLRVLRRQPDGSWKFSHVAWNPVDE